MTINKNDENNNEISRNTQKLSPISKEEYLETNSAAKVPPVIAKIKAVASKTSLGIRFDS
ncbi:MAG TPA: hypothetical protein VMT57_05675 [Candidatus Thermoplasmatota archaeon]|nr:hypothetical protein [Candidatus Thermoplasmatota archaeon]